jgi:hypothetical protein
MSNLGEHSHVVSVEEVGRSGHSGIGGKEVVYWVAGGRRRVQWGCVAEVVGGSGKRYEEDTL